MTRDVALPVRVLIALVTMLMLAFPVSVAMGQTGPTTNGQTGSSPAAQNGAPTGQSAQAGVSPATPALVSTVQVSLDSPSDGSDIASGRKVIVGGWAVDTAGPGTGVDQVKVYLDGPMDNGGTLIGTAKYGGTRIDVATSL